MRARLLLIAAACAVALGCTAVLRAADAPDSPPVLKIAQGEIRGKMDAGAAAYLGIPFAAPPTGPLRWKPPRLPATWTGVRDCTQFGPACPQPSGLGIQRDVGKQDEDCLSLNVWTTVDAAASVDAASPPRSQNPKTTDAARTPRLQPVMVWIHGGGCTTGAGSLPFYNGAALAKAGVVVVTVNYRLGPLGYLAHPLLSKESGEGVSGNYGHLDQIAALRWVQANIAAFGGDPECVTIFGESAGALSVCRLMISPQAKGLFHRAIAQSGGAHGRNRHLRKRTGRLESMEEVGEQVAARLGCDKGGDVLAAMRAKTPAELLAATNPAQGLFGKGIKFAPIVDGWTIPDDAGKLFEQGKFHRVPMMLGSNADEGTMFLQQLPVNRAFGYRLTVRLLFEEQADTLLRLFPVQRDEDVKDALNKLVTVSAFVWPARQIAESMARHGGRAYLYHFTRVPPIEAARKLGAFHGLEIAYAFGNLREGAGFNETDRKLSAEMMARWTRFATAGDPNGRDLPAWPAYNPQADPYMEFGDACAMKTGLYKEACEAIAERKRAAETPGPSATKKTNRR